MPTTEKLAEFQAFLDSRVVYFENDVDRFGYQLVVDEEENIIDQVPHLLINALDLPMLELQQEVYRLGGIFIPAHIDRPAFSLSSQLGFVPSGLKFHAMELSYYCKRDGYRFLEDHPWFSDLNFIQSSDAHFVPDIAKIHSVLEMPFFSFDNFKDALRQGSRLIHDHRVHRGQRLQEVRSLNQDTLPARSADSREETQRNTDDQSARAADDQEGQRAVDPFAPFC